MAVVVQPAFRIEILALKAQRVVDFSDVEAGDFTVGAVVRGPDDFAFGVCQFLRCAEVVELVVEGLCFCWAKAFQQDQRPKTVWLVDIAAMPIRVVFCNQLVALPEKLRGYVVYSFADSPSKRVIAIAGGLPVRLSNTNQPMLAVVTVLGDELMTDQIAEGVVVVMMIALDHQPVPRHDVRAGAVLHEQVAGRVVAEAFLHVLRMVGAGQAGEGVVVVVVFAFAGVEQAGEVASVVDVVVVLALVEGVLLLADGVGVQAVLVVVVVVAEELALLALVFAAGFEQVGGERLAIQFDGGKVAAFVVV
ncbi:hypothetical protein AO063_13915, partial [Pseudomonas fluorescens ICMP 11288]